MDAAFRIEWPTMDFSDDQPLKDEYALDKEMVRDGVLSVYDFMRKWNSDIETEDEARARMEKNRADREALTGSRLISIDAILAGGQNAGGAL